SSTAADAGYVLVIPLGAVIFYSAGRHPLAGIAATFAGVSGGFSANLIPSSLDPLLSGLTQSAVQILDASRTVNPLSNWYFMAASCFLIVAVGWFITDKIVEPRLKGVEIDGDPDEMPKMEALGDREKRGLWAAVASIVIGLGILAAVSIPESSPMRSPVAYKLSDQSAATLRNTGIPPEVMKKIGPIINQELFGTKPFDDAIKARLSPEEYAQYGPVITQNAEPVPPQLTASASPLMQAIVPLIFLLFIIPGIVYGYVAKTVENHRDIIKGMSHAMSTMGYYIVLAFFASLFIAAFGQSNLGALLALKGASFLQWLDMPGQVTIVGIIV